MWLVMFILHPIVELGLHQLDQPYLFRFDLRPTYDYALFLTFLVIVASNIGMLVFGRVRRPLGHGLGRSWNSFTPSIALMCAVLGIGSLAYLSATEFYSATANGDAGAGKTAYIYLMPLLCVPAAVILREYGFSVHSSRLRLVGTGTATLFVAVSAVAGNRTFVVTMVLALGLGSFRRSGRTVSRILVLGVALLGAFFFGALRDANSPSSSFGTAVLQSVKDPVGTLTMSFASSDTEMLDGVAVEAAYVPSIVHFDPIGVFVSTLSAPVPRLLWPGKPPTADVVLNEIVTGRGANEAGVAFSVVGEGYLAGGPLGVVVYGLVLGAVASTASRRFESRNGPDVVLRACIVALIPTITRGIVAYDLPYVAILLFPTVLAATKYRPDTKMSPCLSEGAAVRRSAG